jgi:neutral ceramidase
MGSLKAGMAKAVITPPVGVRLCGYAARTQPSIGVLDDLYAKALVLDDEEKRLALVVCDLLWVGKELVNDIRKRIKEQADIEEENVMITAIHTHYGPDLEHTGEPYIENLKSQVGGAVSAACNHMKNARIGFASGECYVGMNRRNPKSPSGPYFLYNWPQGLVDPTVMVARIEDETRHVVGVLVNYACHPVTLGPNELNISRDYPGHTLRVLEDVFGENVVAMFVNGCCGNINPAWIFDRPDVSPPPPRVFPESLEERSRETRRLGQILGGEALNALQSVTNLASEANLKIKQSDVRLPVRKDMPENVLGWIKSTKVGEPDYENHQRIMKGEDVVTEIQAIRLNDTAILGFPGEVFVEYQLEIRRKSPFKHTFVSELANDSIGYVPTTDAYKEGGYEPNTTFLERDAGSKLTQAAINLLKKL